MSNFGSSNLGQGFQSPLNVSAPSLGYRSSGAVGSSPQTGNLGSSPYTPDGMGLGAGLALGAVTSLINVGGQLLGTRLNKKISDEQWQKQVDYQQAMIADERAYNDPSAQIERLRASGVNPTFAGMSTNLDTGNTDLPDAPQPNPVVSNLGQGIGDDISQGVNAFTQAKNADINARRAEVEKLNIQSLMEYRNSQELLNSKRIEQLENYIKGIQPSIVKIYKNRAEISGYDAYKSYVDTLYINKEKMVGYGILVKKFEQAGLDVQAIKADLSKKLIDLMMYPEILKTDIDLKKAQAKNLNSQTQLNQLAYGWQKFMYTNMQQILNQTPYLKHAYFFSEQFPLVFDPSGSWQNLGYHKINQDWLKYSLSVDQLQVTLDRLKLDQKALKQQLGLGVGKMGLQIATTMLMYGLNPVAGITYGASTSMTGAY